ncbi:MAG TPA: PAS domain S-box protein [Nostocaceae cyanobacterium]|nr:PAS domain S-box protein [Nostocaceae cyanobacterium]
MKKQKYKGFFSITNQLRYGLVLLVVIPLLLISSTLTYLSFQTQIQQLEVLQQEHSQAAAAKINAYLDDLQRKLSYLARVQGLTDLSVETQQKFLTALTRHHSAYETVAILNNSGKIISVVSPYGQANLDAITQAPWILYPLKYKEDFVSPAEIDPVTKEPIVTLAVPIRNQKDEVNGILIARVNLKFLRYFIYQNQIGKTGYAYVIDNRNFLIISKEQAPTSLKFQDLSDQPFIKKNQRLNNLNSWVTYRGLKGVEVIGAVSPINTLRWQIIVELPVAEVYAPIQQMLLFMGVSISIVIIFTIIVSIWFQRQIILPLQRLTTAAKRISKGDLDTHIKVNQQNEMGVLAATFNQMTIQLKELIQDLSQERNFVSTILDTVGALVIVVDQQGRIVRFNRACEEISKYSFPEVQNKYFWELLLLPEAVNSAPTNFLELKPEQFPIDYEGYWLTKDGEKRLISWSITALLDDWGKISYVIASGIDITESKQAEISLKHSEERFRIMVEGSEQVFFYVHDNDHIFQYVSPSVQMVLGYAPEELIGKTCEFIIVDDVAKAEIFELVDQVLLTGERSAPYTVLCCHKNGDILFTEIVETPIIVDGNVVGIQGFARDITKRRMAEIELCQERDFNTTIVQTSPAFFVAINPDGTVKMMNQAMLNALGYTFEEVANTDYISTFVPVEEREILKTVFESAMTQELLPVQENYILTKSGKKLLLDWHGRAIFKEDGQLNFFFGFGIDITERRQAEVQLRAASERERLIAEIALRIRRSLNLQEILNTTVTEVREFLQADRVLISNFKSSWYGRIFAESTAPDWELVYDLFLQDNDYIEEITTLFSQLNLLQVDDISQVKISPKRNYYFEKHQVKSCLAVPIMVGNEFFGTLVAHQCSRVRYWQQTEIELLQQLATQLAIAIQQALLFEQIQRMNLDLERKVVERTAQLQDKMIELEGLYKRQDEFLHAVSHDLRTPIMGTMMLFKHWQQSSVENISLPRNILERMIESGERQLSLINSLLETHATENRGVTLNCEPLQLSNLVCSIVEELEPLLVKNKAVINNLILSNLPIIYADPLQVRRVFENLISNALNHNPSGLQITLQATLEGESIRCFVQDNGVGMTEEQCLQVFERYARGDRSRSTGIGLGLYLCRQIINAHRGEIGVTSHPGSGANFWFTLPINTNSKLTINN